MLKNRGEQNYNSYFSVLFFCEIEGKECRFYCVQMGLLCNTCQTERYKLSLVCLIEMSYTKFLVVMERWICWIDLEEEIGIAVGIMCFAFFFFQM